MRESVKRAAAKADGARRCDRCSQHPCTETIYRICTDMFREGFIKGAAWKQKQLKKQATANRLNPITGRNEVKVKQLKA